MILSYYFIRKRVQELLRNPIARRRRFFAWGVVFDTDPASKSHYRFAARLRRGLFDGLAIENPLEKRG